MKSFFTELKRRNVFKVGVAYAIVAWLLIQVIVSIETPLRLPDWVDSLTIILLIIGFPVALIFAWAFELTPEGIKPTKEVNTEQNITQVSGQKFNYTIIILLVLALVFVVIDSYVIDGTSTPVVAEIANNATPKAERTNSINIVEPIPGFSGRAAIAVLPFVNMSNDPDQEYFADGITEDLITGLQSFQSFPIIARTSTFQYKGTSPDVREVATALGAGYIIEGSVRKVADDVRINVQLIDRQGQHLWAEKFDVPWNEVISLQDGITAKILQAIEPEIIISAADETRYVRTENMEAFDYYLRARAHTAINLGFTDLNGLQITAERVEEARQWAEKAIEKDPNFAAAYALLGHIDGAYVFQLRASTSDEDAAAAEKRAFANGEKARMINPFEPSACSCQALLHLVKGNVDQAAFLQEEALVVNPSSATVHAALAKILHVQGDYDRALQEIDTAMRLSPKDMSRSTYYVFKAIIEESRGAFDNAAVLAARSILDSSNNPYGYMTRITSLYAAGRQAEARRVVDDLYNKFPGFVPLNVFNEPFPDSVTQAVNEPLRSKLVGTAYDAGVQLILEELRSVDPSS